MTSLSEEFDTLQSIRYLDTAAVGIVPASVRSSVIAMLEDRMAWGTAANADMDSDYIKVAAEQAVRCLLGAKSGKSLIASSAMGAIDTVLLSLPRREGTIVCDENDYPGLVDAARRISSITGLELRLVKRVADQSANLFDAIDERTAIVLVSQVHWLTGQLHDLAGLGEARRKHGFFLVVDASQGLPVISLNPEETGVDLLVAAGFKWLAGALGSAIVHVSDRLLNALLTTLEYDYWPLVPSTQSFVAMNNLAASINWMHAFGMDTIQTQTLQAAQAIRDCGIEAGWTPLGSGTSQRSGIVSFPVEEQAADQIAAEARAAGLYVSARGAAIRLSPHFTVSIDDCREAVRLLQSINSTISRT